ncbi:hypothetical protein LWI28_014813 [Acer negundo]|uniref:Uncharacterized protein n=1 Tax=Acer negundo TaxID=4023 RepID=A0AAD5IQ76_ACENE|nr:hypothetical protein LWI28_014813 [Acer negundo]KAK4843126.1 hypothetical protein QYF36_004277 [Acer negundo]
MGNCLFGGEPDDHDHEHDHDHHGGVLSTTMIKVITSNGGIMEFHPPITASCITQEFPGHAIFPSHHLFWKQLSLHEDLQPGKSYYLLAINGGGDKEELMGGGGGTGSQIVREGHIRSNSIPAGPLVSSYRMSFDYQGMLKRSYTEVFSRYNNNNSNNNKKGRGGGFWKVKLVISPENLLEILSQEARTEELIESVRTVAKCGNHHGVSLMSSSSTSAAFSDEWSLSSSSRNASSKKDYLLDIN